MVETLAETPRAAAPTPSAREVLGTLEVPRLGLTAVVRSGVDARTLQDAIGHVPETPRPGDRGNAALAALRDPYFGPLRTIRRGDRLRMRTRNGVREYRVSTTRVVNRNDYSMLERTTDPVITLITPYPFDHVGSAPKRFVVRATTVRPAVAAKPAKASKPPRTAPLKKNKRGFWGKLADAFKDER